MRKEIMSLYNIFFSPTGGTKKVADIIMKGTEQTFETIDLIKQPDELNKKDFVKGDICYNCAIL